MHSDICHCFATTPSKAYFPPQISTRTFGSALYERLRALVFRLNHGFADLFRFWRFSFRVALIGHGCSSALAVPCHNQAEIITRTRGKGTKSASLTASDSADRCSRHHAGRAPLGSFGDAAFHTSGRTAPAMEGSACVDAPRHTAASPRHGSGGQRFASLAEAAQLFAWLPGPPGVKITPVLPQHSL